MSGPVLAVASIVVHDGALLLARRGHGPAAGEWSVPSGRVDHSELLAAAVVRHLARETELEGICGALLGWAESIDADEHRVILNFEVTVLDHGRPVAGSSAAEVSWVPLEDVASLRLVEGLAEALHAWGVLATIA